MSTRLLSFAVWALVAASALFWGLKIFVPRDSLPPQAQMPTHHVAMGGGLARLLGATEVAAAERDTESDAADGGGRFQLLGVVAPNGASHSPQGVALISVGGQPAKPWRTGAVVEGDTVLLAVSRRSAQLGPRGGPATTELNLPEPPQGGGGSVAMLPRLPSAPSMQPAPQQMGSMAPMYPQGAMAPNVNHSMAAPLGLPQMPHSAAKPAPAEQESGTDEPDEQ